MATRKSSRKIFRRRTKHKARTRRAPPSPPLDADAKSDVPSKRSLTRTVSGVLTLFDEALTLVATAASAIEGALDSTVVEDAAEQAEKIECLVRGVKGLRGARIEIAVALYEREVGREPAHAVLP